MISKCCVKMEIVPNDGRCNGIDPGCNQLMSDILLFKDWCNTIEVGTVRREPRIRYFFYTFWIYFFYSFFIVLSYFVSDLLNRL